MSGLTVSAEEYSVLSEWLVTFVRHDPSLGQDSVAILQRSLAEAGVGARARQGLASAIGERIRHAVSVVRFTPGDQSHRLSVSIGGAVFDRRLPLSELLRIADQQLYAAKQNGRNRVSISPIVQYESVPAAAA